MLFEEKERKFLGPKSRSELEFDYLDRSGTQEAKKVREFLEKSLRNILKKKRKIFAHEYNPKEI